MTQEKRVALVTGGNRGIGYEFVKQLATKGFKVVLTSRKRAVGEKVARELRERQLDVWAVEMDVNDLASIRAAAGVFAKEVGRLDVMINNAGVYLDKNEPLLKMDPRIVEETMATNFFGAYHVLHAFFPFMEKYGYGRVINISSEYGVFHEVTYPGIGAYKLSKLALNALTRLVATEVKGDIKVNAADPGWVSSDMGGPSAPRTPKQAAESMIWLATIGSDGPTGKFFRDGVEVEW